MEVLEGRLTVDDTDALVDTLTEVGAAYGATVQAFDARYVVDRAHLERAVTLADRAIDRGENVARDRAVEILLYAAGRRQITRALEMGVDEGTGPVVLLVDGGDEGAAVDALRERLELTPEDTLGVATDEALVGEFFDVGEAELAATDAGLADLVHERVALLDVEK